MYQFNYQIHCIAETVRTVVVSPLAVDRPCFEDTRVGLARDADTRVRLAVFEQNVVVRLVFLDQVVLQQESILLRVDHHIAYIRNMRHQLPGLAALMVFLEVTVHPSMQVLCFANIDYLPISIEILIHSRTMRNALEKRCDMFFLHQDEAR